MVGLSSWPWNFACWGCGQKQQQKTELEGSVWVFCCLICLLSHVEIQVCVRICIYIYIYVLVLSTWTRSSDTLVSMSTPSTQILVSFCFVLFLFLSFQGHTQGIWSFPRLGVELELHLLAYVTATATQDLSPLCNLHHRSQQHQILNLLIRARAQTCILMDASQIGFP